MLYQRIVEAVLYAIHIVHPALPQYDPSEQRSWLMPLIPFAQTAFQKRVPSDLRAR